MVTTGKPKQLLVKPLLDADAGGDDFCCVASNGVQHHSKDIWTAVQKFELFYSSISNLWAIQSISFYSV